MRPLAGQISNCIAQLATLAERLRTPCMDMPTETRVAGAWKAAAMMQTIIMWLATKQNGRCVIVWLAAKKDRR